MKQLSSALKTVLIELRYRLRDGEFDLISNRTLARATGFSEGYISLLMRQLAGETVTIRQSARTLTYRGVPQPFITRVWDSEAGGFVLTMLTPPELRPKAEPAPTPIATPARPEVPSPTVDEPVQLPMFNEEDFIRDHGDDPLHDRADSASEREPSAKIGDHADDPPHPSIAHTDRMRQHDRSRATSVTAVATLGPPPNFTLPEAWPIMLKGTPGYSHDDYLRDRERAESRVLREHPDHLIFWSISRGQPVYGAADLQLREQRSQLGGGQDGERTADRAYSVYRRRGSPDRRIDRDRAQRPGTDPTSGRRSANRTTGVAAPQPSRPALDELPAFLRGGGQTQAGYPLQDLPEYQMSSPPSCVCQLCSGAGFYKLNVPVGHPDFARLFPCRCKLAEREARDSAALHELDEQLQRYRSCRLDTFELDRPLAGVLHWQGHTISEEQQRAALHEAMRIARSYSEQPRGWLYLYGPPGSGKTRLAASIANEFRNRRVRASYGRVQAILNWLKAGFNEQSASAFDQRLQALERVPLLLVDDLGTEYGTAWERTVFENLINERYNRELPTVLTSNCWRDELPSLVADRIAEMAQIVWLTVSSHRRVRSLQTTISEPSDVLLDPWDRGEGES